jgi:hypothetical protein
MDILLQLDGSKEGFKIAGSKKLNLRFTKI